MNSNSTIKRIIIVGNGFDLAHGLCTSYYHFAQKYRENKVIKDFQKYIRLLDDENALLINNDKTVDIKWYSFEMNMERLIRWNYQNEINSGGVTDASCLCELNELFDELGMLLARYLSEEYSFRKFKLIRNAKDCFDENTLAISFNYTDTIKLYTDKYYYVHGSLTDDNYIILGFATGDLPCLCAGDSINYLKEVKKENLSFLRFLRENECGNIEQELKVFNRHALSLFSGRGEYDLEYQKDNQGQYNTKGLSLYLKKYAEQNRFEAHRESFDYSNVEEIIVMGHGLESDLNYLAGVFGDCSKLQKIILFSYDKESEEEIERKVKILRELSGVENVVLRNY